MKNCQKVKKMFVEAIYDELDNNRKNDFNQHLESCPSCKEEFVGMIKTAHQMNNYKRPEADQNFLDNYWINLAPKLSEQRSKRFVFIKVWGEISQFIDWQPSGYIRLATAVCLLLIGVFIGKNYFSTNDITDKQQEIISPATNIVQARATRYLERSKIILMGIVNYDIEEHSSFVPDLSRQKEISRELIHEAAVLKEDLASPEQKTLRKLISDLEVIFLQIANLEEQYDLDAVELIQGGIERKSVLFKINLEEILSTKTSAPKVNNYQSNKSKKKL